MLGVVNSMGSLRTTLAELTGIDAGGRGGGEREQFAGSHHQ